SVLPSYVVSSVMVRAFSYFFFFFFSLARPPPPSPLFPYTTLFRSLRVCRRTTGFSLMGIRYSANARKARIHFPIGVWPLRWASRSEEHTSELQSRFDLVCRLLLEKKKKKRRSECVREIER